MEVLVFTPVWQRPEITKAYCLGLSRLGLKAFCVLSPEDKSGNKELLEDFGIEYTMFKNKLGAKKNHGLREVLKKDFDYLLELNSDDIIKNELMDSYLDLMEQGESFIGLGNFAFYDSETGSVKHNKSTTLFGIGRAYSRSALEYGSLVVDVFANETTTTQRNHFKEGCKYTIHPEEVTASMEILTEPYNRLWDDNADRGMDNHSEAVLKRQGILPTVINTEEPLAFDIKSKENLWSFKDMRGEGYPRHKLLEGLSEAEINYLNELRKD
jgi:hypothetical protein